jgi:signal transduction histidine kinase
LIFFGATYLVQIRDSAVASGSVTAAGQLRNNHTGARVRAAIVALSPNLLAVYGVIMAAAFAVAGWLVVRKTFKPIVSLNDELDAIDPNNLQVQIRIEGDEGEFRELQEHINALLSRISLTFHQLQNYSAQVAHELRAPLTIIRLKIEEAADKIEPSLAEEIQTELLRLTMHVEQALLIARAEQGHLQPNRLRFDLAALLEDVVEDFRLLAKDQDRQIEVAVRDALISADPKYMKQILYSLLTNSLRHGRGTIYIRLQPDGKSTLLSIKNCVKGEELDETLDLGLGRRIVAALVALQGNMQVQTDRKDGWYEVRLLISEIVSAESETTVGETGD